MAFWSDKVIARYFAGEHKPSAATQKTLVCVALAVLVVAVLGASVGFGIFANTHPELFQTIEAPGKDSSTSQAADTITSREAAAATDGSNQDGDLGDEQSFEPTLDSGETDSSALDTDGGSASSASSQSDQASPDAEASSDAADNGISGSGAYTSGAGTGASSASASSVTDSQAGSKLASGTGSASSSNSTSGASSSPSGSASQGSSTSSTSADAATISVTISIDSSSVGNPVSRTETVSLASGSSAYDALVASGVDVDSTRSVFGMYVSAIGGLAEKQHGSGSGWKYAVNGSDASVSASSYTLAAGDVVSWRYVTSLDG